MGGGRKVSSVVISGCVTQLVTMVGFWFHVSGLGISIYVFDPFSLLPDIGRLGPMYHDL